jgi:hypothetical protein
MFEEHPMPVTDPPTLSFYSQPAAMTSAGRHTAALRALPGDPASLAAVAQGLLIHEFIAGEYGVTLSEQERVSVHTRPVQGLLDQVLARDGRPLDVAREPATRLPANCRHFTVLLVTMLRAHGVPARARCGFGGYFFAGRYEDHWAGEYWDAVQQRWILLDAQIDDLQRKLFQIDFDVTDVPRDEFVIAGDAWARFRSGAADPDAFGLSMINESGDWWIAANLMRDAAALGNIELLPWDGWGAMPGPDAPIGDERCALFDRLAALTQDPDRRFDELQRLTRDDERLRVPPAVRNALRDRDEPI